MIFAETAARLGIKRRRTRPFRLETNGKVERFNKTLLEEWAYVWLYRSNRERRRPSVRGCASAIGADHTPDSTASPRYGPRQQRPRKYT